MNKRKRSEKASPPRTMQAEGATARAALSRRLSRTPMYQALHEARHQRQSLARDIEENVGNQLICYVAGKGALIDRDDTLGFVDLLHNVPRRNNLDLMLHTGGGDIDAAEKLISMVRNVVETGRLRVIVPDFAKSAGTLMALGADRIVMSDTSELGPIDPQVTLNDGHGNLIPHSVQSYLDAYEAHSATLGKNPNDLAARIMLGKLDPATVKLFEAVRERARKFAEDQLKRGMFKTGGNFTQIAFDLIDTKRWLTHGQMIGWRDATQMGLSVEYLDPKSNEWQGYWRLYCLQRLAIRDRQKLFESECASFSLDGSP